MKKGIASNRNLDEPLTTFCTMAAGGRKPPTMVEMKTLNNIAKATGMPMASPMAKTTAMAPAELNSGSVTQAWSFRTRYSVAAAATSNSPRQRARPFSSPSSGRRSTR